MIKKIFLTVILLTFILTTVESQTYNNYIWETYECVNLSPESQELIDTLRTEIDKILQAGHLAPLRISGADYKIEGYFLYQEPGRIITTLAMAYPYLTETQKQQVRNYVNNELSNPAYTPWAQNKFMAPNVGARREYYSMIPMNSTRMWDSDSGVWVTTGVWQWDWWWYLNGQYRPRISTLYGLWLYAYNSGDWSVVSKNWSAIKDYYNNNSGEGKLYGTMCAHIAIARMAFHENDTAMMDTAVANAINYFVQGTSFTYVEDQTRVNYYPYHYQDSRLQGGVYSGWMFLNVTPEIGRYLKNADPNLKTTVLNRHNEGKSRFPLWWITKSQYGSTWTGLESVGLCPEIIGMIFPIERWVAGVTKDTLVTYQIENSMYGIGDCYAIEALIYTITAFGTDTWVDVRTKPYISVIPTVLDFGKIEYGDSKTMELTIKNIGADTLYGTLTSDHEWIKLDPTSFTGNNVTIKVTVDNSVLNQKEGQYSGKINIDSNGGTATVDVIMTATCILVKPNPYNPDKGLLTFFGNGIIPDKTTIKIYTLSGELVKTLYSSINPAQKIAQEITWDGKNEEGYTVTSGIYLYTYQSPTEKGIGKFTVSH